MCVCVCVFEPFLFHMTKKKSILLVNLCVSLGYLLGENIYHENHAALLNRDACSTV